MTHSAQNVSLLEMAHVKINKSVALANYAKELGIDASEVAAFGDMPNDQEMLAWAGYSYAMAPGHRTALDAARAATRPRASRTTAWPRSLKPSWTLPNPRCPSSGRNRQPSTKPKARS